MLTRQQIERWSDLVNRLDQFGRDGSDSVITVHILTDKTGRPVLWTDPERARFEPRAGVAQVLETLMNSD